MKPELPRAPLAAPTAITASAEDALARGGRGQGRVGRAQRRDQIAPGVGISDRIHVEGIDLGAMGLEEVDGAPAPRAHGVGIQRVEH